ncbi:hypothetical protein J5U22_02328 [Saccharolobus shibatae]|uniref:Uncharacterized protein n=1 Tax=Saccharolobus shibatae TaxID=2286 RepID=A0A8F5C2H6_9CREN|nr:hypothetical protein J5U22_02328 [Saccharolobus shibatae]
MFSKSPSDCKDFPINAILFVFKECSNAVILFENQVQNY